MKKNLIKLTVLVGLFVLFAGRIYAEAKTKSDEIQYEKMSSYQFFYKDNYIEECVRKKLENKNITQYEYKEIKTSYRSSLEKLYKKDAYEISNAFIIKLEGSTLEFGEPRGSKSVKVDITEFSEKMKLSDPTWCDRIKQSVMIPDSELNGKYTICVYFKKGNPTKATKDSVVVLQNIMGIPTEEQINEAKQNEKNKHEADLLAKEEVDAAARKALEKPLYSGTLLLLYAGSNQKSEFHIGYNDVADSCFLYTKYIPQGNGFIPTAPNSDVNHKFYITLDDLETLTKALTKYKEWVKIAKENQAIIGDLETLGKEIPNLYIDAKVVQDVHSKAPLVGEIHDMIPSYKKLSFRVISNDVETHLFSIMVGDQTTETSAIKAHIMMFAEPWADDLLAGLKKINGDTIANIKAEINKKKEKQEKDKSLFN